MRLLILLTVVLNPAFAAVLSGIVRTMDGAAIPGALVMLRPPGYLVEVARARTDSAGEYSFFDVPAGTYDLVIQSAGFNSTRVRDVRLSQEAPKLAPPVALLVSGCGEYGPQFLRFSEPAAETGRLSGTVAGRNRSPIRGAVVSAVCIGKPACGATTSTDAGGAFELSLRAGAGNAGASLFL